MLMDSRVRQRFSYELGSTLIHTSAARVAASKTAALAVSVRRNLRSGASRFRAHAVRPENDGPACSVIHRFCLYPGSSRPTMIWTGVLRDGSLGAGPIRLLQEVECRPFCLHDPKVWASTARPSP